MVLLSERYVRAMMEFVMHIVMGELCAVQHAALTVQSKQMEAHHDLDILGHTRYALSGSS